MYTCMQIHIYTYVYIYVIRNMSQRWHVYILCDDKRRQEIGMATLTTDTCEIAPIIFDVIVTCHLNEQTNVSKNLAWQMTGNTLYYMTAIWFLCYAVCFLMIQCLRWGKPHSNQVRRILLRDRCKPNPHRPIYRIHHSVHAHNPSSYKCECRHQFESDGSSCRSHIVPSTTIRKECNAEEPWKHTSKSKQSLKTTNTHEAQWHTLNPRKMLSRESNGYPGMYDSINVQLYDLYLFAFYWETAQKAMHTWCRYMMIPNILTKCPTNVSVNL